MQDGELEQASLIATALMAVNLLVGFVTALITQTILISSVAGGGAFLEFGLLLITGACLMSRQPLEDKDRYTDDGSYSKVWKMALLGRKLLIAALVLFVYFIAFSFTATVYGF
ncbi:MAG: hypothetical protein RTV31_12965 [Candidatus Thorarchaeota archaeon]